MFTIKQIRGAEVEKNIEIYPLKPAVTQTLQMVYQAGIDVQSSVKLRFNREKLAKVIFAFDYKITQWNEFKTKHDYYYELADAIIKAADDDPNSVLEVANANPKDA